MQPEKGIKNDISIFDFESEYPSTMLFGNMGADALIGMTSDQGKTFVDNQGNVHEIEKDKHIWTVTGAVFDKLKDSSMRTVVSRIFDQRVEAKNRGKAIEAEIKYLKELVGDNKK
jgi:DNA polymerase elongation subunit (family B)